MSDKKTRKKKVEEQPQVKHTIFGGAIGYDSPSDFDKFITSLDKNQALHMLVAAVNYAQIRGIFNLQEASLLAASIKAFVPQQQTNSDNTQPTQE